MVACMFSLSYNVSHYFQLFQSITGFNKTINGKYSFNITDTASIITEKNRWSQGLWTLVKIRLIFTYIRDSMIALLIDVGNYQQLLITTETKLQACLTVLLDGSENKIKHYFHYTFKSIKPKYIVVNDRAPRSKSINVTCKQRNH